MGVKYRINQQWKLSTILIGSPCKSLVDLQKFTVTAVKCLSELAKSAWIVYNGWM